MNFSTDRLTVLVACAIFAALCAPVTAVAQDAPDTEQKQPKAHFEKEFEPAGVGEKVRLSIEPTVAKDRWEIHVVGAGKRGKALVEEQLPSWLVKDHYGFEVSTAGLGNGKSAVILAVLPGLNGDAPPAATQYQVVWIVDKHRRAQRWRQLSTAQYSSLDGGERFVVEGEAKSKKLVRRRRGSDSIFCGATDDDPVLFDQYDPKSGEFEQKLDIQRLLDGAPTLKADATDEDFNPPALQAWYQWFAASSDRRSPDRRGALIRPLELGDRSSDTGWMEGVDGLGRGEFVSAQVNDAVGLSSLRIVPGVGDEKLFKAFARPTKLLVGLSEGERYVVELGSVTREQVESGRGVLVELPEPVKTRCMSIMLLESKRGQRVKGKPRWTRDTTALAEVTPYSELHRANAEKTAARVVEMVAAEENSRARQRISELALGLQKQLVVQVRRALETGTAEQRRRIIPLMASLPADEAVPMLIKFLRDTEPSAPEYRVIKRTLAAHYRKAAPALVEFLNEHSPDDTRKYTDVLRLLGRVGEPSHLTMLIDGLGQGGRTVRNERIRAIGAGGKPLVEPLLKHAREHVNADGGYDALRALNLLGKRLHYAGIGELPSPELLSAMLEASEDRRTLIRGLRVAKFFYTRGFVESAREKYVVHQDALVRRAAVGALERYPSPQARDLIVDALADDSPDVRIGAVSALAERDDVAGALSDVLEYSRNEKWKPGLQQAFRVLADIKNDETDEAFEKQFRDQPNTTASLLAAQALDRAGRPIDPKLARSLVENPEVHLDMRLEMLDLLGVDQTDAGEAFLLETLANKGWEKLAKPTRHQNQLRDHVMLSLGRRRSDKAMPRLLEVAKTSKSVDIQQVALRSLAFYQDESLLRALQAWKKTASPEIADDLDQTITMIDRRRSITSAREDLNEVLSEDDAAEKNEKSETKGGDDASNDSDSE